MIKISSTQSLPIESVTQTFAILAKRGVGKTHTGSVMAEEMLKAGQQIVAIDPTGAWWGLRSGFPVVIFGGEHADVPIEEAAGEIIAQAIVDGHLSAVIDLSLLRKAQSRRFLTPFLETLYRVNREPLHLFVDEADDVCPQRPFGDEAQMVGAMEDVVKRGRKKGIGCTLITQRPADLAKQVLTQCEVLIAMRLTHPRDINAIKEWVNVHGDPKTADSMIAGLPALPVGTAWIWSPGWGDIFNKVKIRHRETFDSSATPKPGESAKKPKTLAEIDLNALGEKIKGTIERVKENDPATLRKRIRELESQKTKQSVADPNPELIERAIAKTEQKWRTRFNELQKSIRTTISRLEPIANALEAIPEPRKIESPQHEQKVLPVSTNGNGTHGGGALRMLAVLAQYPEGRSAKQVALMAGLSPSSGTFSTYLGRLRSEGLIDGTRERLVITESGIKVIGNVEPLPVGDALFEYWKREVGSGPARLLDTLKQAPRPMSRDELAESSGFSHSGTFSTYLGRLRTLELIQGSRELSLAEELQ